MSDRVLAVTPSLSIPLHEVLVRASASGGPGGQHVNRTATRIEAVWNVAESTALDDAQRQRLLARLASRLDSTGALRVVASEYRSQLRNRDAALERLSELVRRGLVVPRKRKATRPTKASKEKRLEGKRRRSATKRDRRRPHDE